MRYDVFAISADHGRALREIPEVIGDVDSHHIRATYGLLTHRPRTRIEDGIRDELDEVVNIQAPIWPADGNDMSARESALEHVMKLCSKYCVSLKLPVSVSMMAPRTASRVWNVAPINQTCRVLQTLAPACVYMAGYLIGSSRPLSVYLCYHT